MVDNLAEKVNECPLNRGRWVLLAYNWDRENCPLYRVAGYLLFRGCVSIEVNGRAVGTFRIVRYIVGVRYSGVSAIQGCPLSGVPLYPIMFNFTLYVCAENFPIMKLMCQPVLVLPYSTHRPCTLIPPSTFPMHKHTFLQQWIRLVRLAPAVNIGCSTRSN